jgi:3-hydroxyacyl-CoA dehydrogenase/3a,7a,12a-trihydroxy-5b-cholest-24-enoyl-CoA hydratase
MSDADFMAMATGKADAMKLFGTGKLKISGDVMASQKLGFLKKLTPEMVLAQVEKRTGGSAGASAAAGAPPADIPAGMTPTSWDVFIAIRDHIERNPDLVDKVQTTFLFKIKNPDSAWTLDLKNGKGSVVEGAPPSADCTLEIAEGDFLDMTQGKSDPMKLFTTGKLKISGNVMASQKLGFLQKIDPAQAIEAVKKARAAGAAPTAAASGGSASSGAKAVDIFAAIEKRLASNPGLAAEVGAQLTFKVGDQVKTFELGASKATITIADADLADLAAGKTSARDLYQHGKLRVDGDVQVAHRLGFLKGLI